MVGYCEAILPHFGMSPYVTKFPHRKVFYRSTMHWKMMYLPSVSNDTRLQSRSQFFLPHGTYVKYLQAVQLNCKTIRTVVTVPVMIIKWYWSLAVSITRCMLSRPIPKSRPTPALADLTIPSCVLPLSV